jgi:hypothetical protein
VCPELTTSMLFEEEPVQYREASLDPQESTPAEKLQSVDGNQKDFPPPALTPTLALFDVELPSAVSSGEPLPEAGSCGSSLVRSRLPVLGASSLRPITLIEPPDDSSPQWTSPITPPEMDIQRGSPSASVVKLEDNGCDAEPCESSSKTRLGRFGGEADIPRRSSSIDDTYCYYLNSSGTEDEELSSRSSDSERSEARYRSSRRRRRRDYSQEFTPFKTMSMQRHETLQEFATRLEDAFCHSYPSKDVGTSRALLEKFLGSFHPRFREDMRVIVKMKRLREKFNWRTMKKCISKMY